MASILIVDDNDINRQILVKLLGRYKHQLQEACDGVDALEKLNAFSPDLIITDILMPNMDGHELVRQLRAKPQTVNIPIIIYTALYLARTAHTFAQTYGVSNILTKPSKPEAIVKAVETALGSPFQEADPLEVANRRLQGITELGEQLVSEQNPLQLLQNFCERVRKIIGAKFGFLGILNESQSGLQHFFANGIEVEIARERIMPTARELLERVLSERIPLHVRGVDLVPQTSGTSPSLEQYDSILGAPIMTATKLYGWICLVDKLGAKEFGEEEERLSKTLASQLAIAFENLSQQAELKIKIEQLERETIERRRAQEALEKGQVRPASIVEKPADQTVSALHRRIAQLEAAGRDHEAFTRFVATDLRGHLQVLSDNSGALIDHYSHQLDAAGAQSLYIIFNVTNQIKKLISDLLALSQIGRKELEKTSVDLEILARSVVAEMRQLEPSRSLNITIQPLPPVQGDYSMIKQILINLIANAFKFTRARPTPMIEIGFRHDGQENIYYVKDNGVGFDMQHANKLFNIFQRLHQPEEFEGNGLGLVAARRAIERHSGRVWAESDIDAGATFYFTIPKEQINGR